MSRIGIVLVIAPLLVLGLHYASEWILIERCLDAGGSFNYRIMSCTFTEQWDHIPYSVRHRWNLNIALGISVLGLVMTAFGGRRRRPARVRSYS